MAPAVQNLAPPAAPAKASRNAAAPAETQPSQTTNFRQELGRQRRKQRSERPDPIDRPQKPARPKPKTVQTSTKNKPTPAGDAPPEEHSSAKPVAAPPVPDTSSETASDALAIEPEASNEPKPAKDAPDAATLALAVTTSPVAANAPEVTESDDALTPAAAVANADTVAVEQAGFSVSVTEIEGEVASRSAVPPERPPVKLGTDGGKQQESSAGDDPTTPHQAPTPQQELPEPEPAAAEAEVTAVENPAATSASPSRVGAAVESTFVPPDLGSNSVIPGAAHSPAQVATAPTAETGMPSEVRFASDNHDNIVRGMRAEVLPNGGTMRIRLDPPQLGALQVTVHIRDGVVTAAFETSSDEATRLLGHSLNQLKSVLESHGVTVDKLQVQQSPKNEPQHAPRDGQQDRGQSGQDQENAARQEQQRREMLRRMWRRIAGGADPLDVTG